MGLITGALQIGRSALMAYQSALQVVGNNIANVSTDGYTRQTPILTPGGGITLAEGFQPGGGVALTGLRRNVDDSIEDRYRIATGDQAGARMLQDVLGRIESSMNELSDSDLSTLLQSFFNAFSTLQTNPTDTGARTTVLTAGDSLARELQRQRAEVASLRDELNRELQVTVERANQLASDVAELNVRIAELESSGRGTSNSLRDQRDQLLRELGELAQIQVREQPGGAINVYVGNEPLVQGGLSRGLASTLEIKDGNPTVTVHFADNNGLVTVRGGKIAGLIEARDTFLVEHVAQLDNLAATLIAEVNKVHSQGQGLRGFTDTTGVFDVRDADVVLNSTQAGLSLKPGNGSFVVTVTDQRSGLSHDYVIPVDLDGIGTDDSLNRLAARINSKLTNAGAQVTGDNRLRFVADSGFEVTFGQDSSNVLAALGVNVFFTGTDASDLAVSSELTGNPDLLAAATQRAPGDGSNAARLAALGSEPVAALNGRSISDFYNGIVSDVAVKGAAAKAAVQATAAIGSALASQRESVSGVNLDEETVSLLKLQRAFEGVARYTTTVNGLIGELLAIVG
ncbi:MAG: flagellar hook-associated protein FlgK [Planctomycetes bacterium]|nr:flagellar hook-associated protein FlgK [Planctomycetota bacterium]